MAGMKYLIIDMTPDGACINHFRDNGMKSVAFVIESKITVSLRCAIKIRCILNIALFKQNKDYCIEKVEG